MTTLSLLARDGARELLRSLCVSEARFKDLNEVVPNTRTLTRRLKELRAKGLVRKVGNQYVATVDGFDIALGLAELEAEAKKRPINQPELAKLRHGWMRVSMRRLAELFLAEFRDELISLVVYGSAATGSFETGVSDLDLFYVLADGTREVWQRESRVFRAFRSTWEYVSCDRYFKAQGSYGYPEVTAAWLSETNSKVFQPIYLDMLRQRVVLLDRREFFEGVMRKLEVALRNLGTVRIEHADGTYGWVLKPDLAPGELVEVDLV